MSVLSRWCQGKSTGGFDDTINGGFGSTLCYSLLLGGESRVAGSAGASDFESQQTVSTVLAPADPPYPTPLLLFFFPLSNLFFIPFMYVGTRLGVFCYMGARVC
jgi:hypothetical protein